MQALAGLPLISFEAKTLEKYLFYDYEVWKLLVFEIFPYECMKVKYLHIQYPSMIQLVEDPEYFKEEFNLRRNYMACMNLLRRMVYKGCIPDIFFDDINLLRYIMISVI